MRIIHVIPGLQKAAGTTVFAVNVVAGLRERGHEVEICTTFGELVRGKRPDVVHIHGVWPLLLHRASRWARQNGIPVVWSTHGMTAPWSMRHKWWKKIVAWWLYQRWDLRKATVIHCTTELEAGWNRALGLKNSSVVVPLGTKGFKVEKLKGFKGEGEGRKEFVVLFVGRIHPVKGLMNLVRAAGLINRTIEQSNNPNNRTILFRLVGPDQDGHMAELKAEVGELGIGNGERGTRVEVSFVGEKHGEDLEWEYENCDVLVLPSWTENFGGVVVDALAHGKPVIASRFTPWKTLEDERCGWWVDNSPESLAATLMEASGAEGLRALPEMGERGRRLVEEHYTWSAVCEKILEAYKGVGAGKMKVLHLVARMGLDAGGLSRLVQGMVAGLCERGVDAWICPFDGTEPWVPGVRKITLKQSSNRTIEQFDLVHIHGIWDWRLHRMAVKCRRRGIKYVVSPQGMLEPWPLQWKWLKKRIGRWLYQDRDLHGAAALHATAESEAEQFRALGFRNKIIVAPNGVIVPEGELFDCSDCSDCSIVRLAGQRRALAEKKPDCLTRKERECIVSRIEQTENVLIHYPDDPGLLSFIKGYWDGDAKTTRAIVDWGHRIVPESVINVDIGEIQTHKNSIRSILFHTKFRGPLKVLVLARLADILRNAVLYNKGRDGNEVFYNLAHRLRFDLGNGAAIKEFIVRLIVKETPDGNRTWTVEFSNKKELTGMPTTGEAATVEVTRLKSPSTHTILKMLYAVNGGDGLFDCSDCSDCSIVRLEGQRRALFVSRMHPKKGVLELVESWARLKQSNNPNNPNNRTIEQWCCELVYTMNGAEERAYEQKVKDRILALGMTYVDNRTIEQSEQSNHSPDFILTGPLDDTAKWNAYARADLFVLPTYSENFGIVVAEALWAGVPVITTKGAPWAELEERRCGWWIDLPEVEVKVEGEGERWNALDAALREAMSLPATFDQNTKTVGKYHCSPSPLTFTSLEEMGARGHQLVAERYTWAAVCEKMIEGYRSLGV